MTIIATLQAIASILLDGSVYILPLIDHRVRLKFAENQQYEHILRARASTHRQLVVE